MMPLRHRLGCRHLAHCIAGAVSHQLHLDISGSIFAIGLTSQLISNTLAATLAVSILHMYTHTQTYVYIITCLETHTAAHSAWPVLLNIRASAHSRLPRCY
jgi:hypothetical protein